MPPKHKLGAHVEAFGSEQAVVRQVLVQLEDEAPASGLLEVTIEVGGQNVVVG